MNRQVPPFDEAVLRDETAEGRCHVQDGPSLPPATVRRPCCDGSLEASAGVAALTTLHVKSGLELGPRTAVTKWWGERMDYNEAVGALQERAQRGELAS